MLINLGYNNKIVYANLEIPDEYFEMDETRKKLIQVNKAKELLDNLDERNDVGIPLITAFNLILDYTIEKYEEKEKYEQCAILLDIKRCVEIINRPTFNEVINERKSY